MPVLSGRTFEARDGDGGERTVVINQTMAERYWPGENPLGRRVRARSMETQRDGSPAPWLTIIGIVGDVRTYGLESDARAEMYVSFRQRPGWTASMITVVRGTGPAARLSSELRRRGRAVDPQVPLDVGTLDDLLQNTLATRVLTLSLLSAFAAIALLLAAIGIYGVLAYAVSQRTRELALRAALGAPRAALLGLVLGAGMRVVGVGILVGIAGAIALTRVLETMLVDVAPRDPWSYGAAVAVLLAVSVVAILVPARRATRLDPMLALQGE
jgi:putative ABC transport system permease protein